MHNSLTQYDPDIGYTFIPGLKLRVPHESGGYLVSTNRLGFRERELVDDGRPNIFVFGDSFTAGDGVSNGKRWSDHLASHFASHNVYNFGLPGTGTDQQFIAWQKFAADRPCALLVVAVLVENIRRITAAYRPAESSDGQTWFKAKPYFSLDAGRLVRHHDPVPLEPVAASALEGEADRGGRFPVLRRLVNAVGLKDLIQQMTAYQPVPDYDDAQSPGWQLMAALLSAWSKARHGPMAIMPIPLYQHVEQSADSSAYQARFAELGAALGRPIIDPLPALQSFSPEARRGFRFASDVHLTPDGHMALAEAVVPAIESTLKVSA